MIQNETINAEISSNIDTIISAILSNPLGTQTHKKIRIFKNDGSEKNYFVEFFTKTQSFHKTFSKKELSSFLKENCGLAYKNCVITTKTETITFLSNKKGKITVIKNPLKSSQNEPKSSQNKQKNYIIKEGIPVPFLVHLGIMSDTGKIVTSKYDKFRQINRFLEFIDDILPKEIDNQKAYTVLDFGCGKSYLTFALYYFLVEIRKIKAQITGIDLKEDVIQHCSKLAKSWGYTGLEFKIGRIEDYKEKEQTNLDLVITLHACDTATDYALNYAVSHNAKTILSVPCCQHELNAKLSKSLPNEGFNALMKYGIIKERFASLATDVMRAELLESKGYKVQLMEFIDMEHTAKNLLIRAVKKQDVKKTKKSSEYQNLCESLGLENMLATLLKK